MSVARTASRPRVGRRPARPRSLAPRRLASALGLLALGASPLLAEPVSSGLLVSPSGGTSFIRSATGAYHPAEDSYLLSNPGFASIPWEASTGAPWVSVTPDAGTLAAVGQSSLSVAVVASVADQLGPGTHTTTLAIQDLASGTTSIRTLTLSITSSGPELRLSPPSGFQAGGPSGGPFIPSSKTYVVENVGNEPMAWSTSTGPAWLSPQPAGGTLAPGEASTLRVVIDGSVAATLGVGTHLGSFSVRNETNGDGDVSLGARLDVFADEGGLAVDPDTGFASSGPAGGPFVPGARVYTLSNEGSAPLYWTASKSSSWISLSATSGVLQPGAQASVSVSIAEDVAVGLGTGQYTGSVLFVNETDGSGTTSRPVTLTVGGGPGDLQVSPSTGLTVLGTSAGLFVPSGTTYVLSNASGDPLEWSASTTRPWIELSSTGGVLDPGEQAELTVAIDAAAAILLGPGRHVGAVAIANETTPGSGGGSTIRPVSLTVIAISQAFHVFPGEGLVATGPVGGPFPGASMEYMLSNLSAAPLSWTASASRPWVSVSPASGGLVSGGRTVVTVSIDQARAASLGVGHHTADVDLVTDEGSMVSRTVELTVTGTAEGLTMGPSQGLTSTGLEGGPFAPASMGYVLSNGGSSPVAWSASASRPWVSLSATSGQVAAGADGTLTVSIDQGVAAGLSPGGYSAVVDVFDETNGVPVGSRTVGLNVLSSSGSAASSLSQFGITWTFDGPYSVGQFVNGDWWVVGPVTIVGISPPSTSGGREKNGSMVNPDPVHLSQSYDSEMFAQYATPSMYDSELNAALDVSPSNPLVLPPHSSLVSTISLSQAGLRPQLSKGAILTVLPAPAPPGSFRPPYCGSDKSIEFHHGQLDYSKLARLAPVGNPPSLSAAEQWFERPWLDHVPTWVSQYFHPKNNMPNYGREIADRIGAASLLLHLDYSNAQKRTLLVRLVQVGIDMYGVVEAGGRTNWAPRGGGHKSGRKWPILFAGLMLDDPDMSSIGSDPTIAFAEDDQTFYVQETSPGVYNNGHGGYGPQHAGLAEWGGEHATAPWNDTVEWFTNPYRTCCTANSWWGEVLSARIMGARSLWNHEALFDYMDRYRSVAPTTGQVSWTISWTPFPLAMWDAYRDDF